MILDLVDDRLEQTNPFITVYNFSGSYGGYGRRQTSSSLPRFPAGIATRYVWYLVTKIVLTNYEKKLFS